jgi:hypothetical protein
MALTLENQQNVQPAIQLRALDRQMRIDMQQEKVTDNGANEGIVATAYDTIPR